MLMFASVTMPRVIAYQSSAVLNEAECHLDKVEN